MKRYGLRFAIFIMAVLIIIVGLKIIDTNTNEELEENGHINVKDFGAVGDGMKDDTIAIQTAINSLPNGGVILFEKGKTYRIKDTLQVSSNISLQGPEQRDTVIYMDNDEKPIIHIIGSVKSEKIVTTNLLSKKNVISVEDAVTTSIGDLILIESNLPWYYDPRTGTENLHKGELHRIKGVTTQNITLEENMWETYNSMSENVTIKNISPVSASIENLTFERESTNNRTIGIILEFCNRCKVKNVSVNNSISTGIFIDSSYQTVIQDSVIYGSNDKGSGYGIQTYGSTFSHIKNNEIWGSRRGIDISGDYPDHHSIVENNTVNGGGKNELGKEYLTADTQYGVGTHSTARYTTFKGNTLINLSYGINVRSPSVTIVDNTFKGYLKGAIILTYGNDIVIRDNVVLDNLEGANKATQELYPIPTAIKEYTTNTFLIIKKTYNYNNSSTRVNGNEVKVKEFVKFMNVDNHDNPTISNLVIDRNKINFIDSGSKVAHLISSEYPLVGVNCVISNNEISLNSGVGVYVPNHNFQDVNS